MKVLMLGSKEYPFGSGHSGEDPLPSGGIELYVDNLLRYVDKDINFIVITRKFSSTPKTEKKGNIEIHRMPFIGGFYFRNPSFNFLAFLKALKIDFDIIISNDDIANMTGFILSKIKGKPVIMVCHGLPSEQPQYNILIKLLLRLIERIAYNHSSINVTHSPNQMSKITENYKVILPGFDKKRTAMVSEAEKANLKQQYGIGNKKVIAFVGRLIRVKGVEYLLYSLRRVKKPHICFIIGDGPQAGEYKRLAKELGVNVVFTGFRNDVNRFLSISDVFVLPSISESLNYAMLEAASMGIPIVSTDLGIIPNDAALIVKKKDPKALSDAIIRVLENSMLAKNLSRNARRFSGRFKWQKAAKEYTDMIRRLA